MLDGLPPEVEVVRQENRGVCAARNTGLARVETTFALVLDADDRLRPDALELLRAPLEQDATLGFAYGRMGFFGDWDGVLGFPPYDPYALLYGTRSASARSRAARSSWTPAASTRSSSSSRTGSLAPCPRARLAGHQVDAVTVEYRKHAGRSCARTGSATAPPIAGCAQTRRSVRTRRELAAESDLGLVGRLVHRAYWGPRPMPARVEQALHRLYFRA